MADTFRHTFKNTVKAEEESLNSIEQSWVADAHTKINPTIPASTTNLLIDIAFTVAGLKSCWISSDKAVTIKTNDSTTPQETITIAAGIPLIWNANSGVNQFAGDVTAMYVSNADTGPAEMKIRILHDKTPAT